MKKTMLTSTRLRGLLRSYSAVGMLCLALTLSQGCSRSEPPNAGSASSEQSLPFHPDAEPEATSDGAHPDRRDKVQADPKSVSALPFRAESHARVLPSGTLLTVQLEDSLSTARVRAGDLFTAVVTAPLALDGDTLIPRGTVVTGRIESAQSPADRPGLVPGTGFFRLTLSAITVEGRQIPLQTSSLFARGAFQPPNLSPLGSPSSGRSSDSGPDGVQVRKGRRLTFRLTAPVTLDDPNSMANRQSPGPIPE
jgi:hypothetical protein